MYRDVIYNQDKGYKIIDIIPKSNFLNSNDTINTRVLGLYVNQKGGNHVLERGNHLLICEKIEEAVIVN